MTSSIERTQRRYRILGKTMIVIGILTVAFFVAAYIFFQMQSPIYRFVNDTGHPIDTYLIGSTSPGVRFHLEPDEVKTIDMPFWWGEPELPRTASGERVQPSFNIGIYKVYKLSTFPEDWLK